MNFKTTWVVPIILIGVCIVVIITLARKLLKVNRNFIKFRIETSKQLKESLETPYQKLLEMYEMVLIQSDKIVNTSNRLLEQIPQKDKLGEIIDEFALVIQLLKLEEIPPYSYDSIMFEYFCGRAFPVSSWTRHPIRMFKSLQPKRCLYKIYQAIRKDNSRHNKV